MVQDRKLLGYAKKDIHGLQRYEAERGGSGCPDCARKKHSEYMRTRPRKKIHARVSPEYNLKYLYPEIAKEWDYKKNELDPENYTPYSTQVVWWKCSNSHEWQAKIQTRTKGSGCRRCYLELKGDIQRKAVIEKRGSLADRFPEVLEEWAYGLNEITPDEVPAFTKEKVYWVNKEGEIWKARIGDKVRSYIRKKEKNY